MRQNSHRKVRLSVDCSQEERQQVKLLCTLHNKTISEWVMECVREKIQSESANLPNKKTVQALRESDRGEGVVTYDSVEELFSSLGL
jgi:hypothetical protein